MAEGIGQRDDLITLAFQEIFQEYEILLNKINVFDERLRFGTACCRDPEAIVEAFVKLERLEGLATQA